MYKIVNFIYRFFCGYVKVCMYCSNMERYINALNNIDIYIWKLCFNEKYCEFYITVRDLKKTRRLIKKIHGKLEIKEKHGLPFIVFNNRNKVFLGIGIITSFCLIIYLSGFIWDIRLYGNYSYTYTEISDVLKNIGIKEGLRKKYINGEDIEKYIRNKYFDIKWVSVDIHGTVMSIRIKENFDKYITASTKEASDIIATRDGTIESIITRNGVPMVKKGDYVKAGDIIIGGTINITDDNGEIAGVHTVVADGDIYINTEYIYEKIIYRKKLVKKYTGNNKSMYHIGILNDIFCIKAGKIKYKDYDIVSNTNNMVLGDSFFIPLYISKSEIREYNLLEYNLNDAELNNAAQYDINEFISKLENKGGKNIIADISTEINKESIIIKGIITASEPAVKYEKINNN